jgi:aspartate-semialdehyde dehydrogenase
MKMRGLANLKQSEAVIFFVEFSDEPHGMLTSEVPFIGSEIPETNKKSVCRATAHLNILIPNSRQAEMLIFLKGIYDFLGHRIFVATTQLLF